MKARFIAAILIAAIPIAFTACDNKQEAKDGAVFIESTWELVCPEWDVQPGSSHVFIERQKFKSQLKQPGNSEQFLDVELRDLWVTFKRLDGGTPTAVPPRYHQTYHIQVPAGGEATLNNGRILPPEDLLLPPFDSLWPENGGVDPSTGRSVIEMGATVEYYGSTYSGDDIKTSFTVPLEFRYGYGCNSPGSSSAR